MRWNGNAELEPKMARKNWHRRHAVQIVAQLPENSADALQVLDLARQLVEGFLCADQPRKPTEVKLVSAAASERCRATDKPSSTPR